MSEIEKLIEAIVPEDSDACRGFDDWSAAITLAKGNIRGVVEVVGWMDSINELHKSWEAAKTNSPREDYEPRPCFAMKA